MNHRTATARATAIERIEQALFQLPSDEELVLRSRYGFGIQQLDVEELAAALGTDAVDVWRLEAEALETVGFLLLTSTTPEERAWCRNWTTGLPEAA